MLINLNTLSNPISTKSKIWLKQSYILLTWFYYLTFINQKHDTEYKLKFSVYPNTRKIFTLTKAPIAHKNWSKEQYKFQFFKFKISFDTSLNENNVLNNINKTLLFIFITKKEFPNLESNILFLKNFKILIQMYDNSFFNLTTLNSN